MVRLEHISHHYAARGGVAQPALRDVTLRIAAGEHVAVLGRSGSGKSTLLNLIAGIDKPTSGLLEVAGVAPGTLGESALARWRGRHVGVVFQFFQLLPTLTVLENVVLAMDLVGHIAARQRRSRALMLLAQVGVPEQADKLPAMLSGGQQQRAAIARALANDPPLLLADEPTGNLDSETALAVVELFSELAQQGKTLLIVSHDARIAAAARRVVELRDGAVFSDAARAGLGP
jgi:putative ABC transport system ATP-binding protein